MMFIDLIKENIFSALEIKYWLHAIWKIVIFSSYLKTQRDDRKQTFKVVALLCQSLLLTIQLLDFVLAGETSLPVI